MPTRWTTPPAIRFASLMMTAIGGLVSVNPGTLEAAPPMAKVAARTPLVTVEDQAVTSRKLGPGHYFLDFGKATFASLELRFPSEPPAGTIQVHLGEKTTNDGRVDRKPGATIRYQQIELPVGPGAKSFRARPVWKPLYHHWINNPDGMDEVTPFRYAELEGVPETFDPKWVTRLSRQVAFDDAASEFDSSDPTLNAVWDLCKHSIKATTFLGIYVDGDRERKPYEADALINQWCHYGVDAHYQTGRLTHEHLLSYPTWPMEWRQQSVLMAWADYLYSGDDQSIRKHWTVLQGRLMLDRRRDDGLFLGQNNGEPRDIIDWPTGERDGYDMTPRVKTVTTAFHAHSLDLMARMATAIGKPDEAARYAAMHRETVAAMNEMLFDPARGIYVDGMNEKTGEKSAHASLHANMFPLAFGLVPDTRIAGVADFVQSRGMACSVYGAQFLLDALYETGRADHALALMTARHDRSWYHMLDPVGSTITLEAWDQKYKNNLDWNHAWGAAPANIIPRKLMGIEPVEPGFRKFRVRPQIASLAHAAIRAPSPKGPIELKITRPDGGWQADLSVPKGTMAEVHVPSGKPEAVLTEGRDPGASARFLRMDHGSCVFAAGPGSWRFRVVRAK